MAADLRADSRLNISFVFFINLAKFEQQWCILGTSSRDNLKLDISLSRWMEIFDFCLRLYFPHF